jgi:GAF domain-containing protein
MALAHTRQSLTATAFVDLVDTLVSGFDVIEVLTGLTARCVELLDCAAAGILFADGDGHLRVIGASSEQIRLLELLQVQDEKGPCLDSYTTGRVVINSDLRSNSAWPAFADQSVLAGFPSVCAIPLRLRDATLGCLNLFMSEPVALSDADVQLAQALADVASIAVVQDHATRAAVTRESQLQHALTSRTVIEQAKGMIAERAQVAMDRAFADLRTYARSSNRRLTEVAEALVAGTLSIAAITSKRRVPPPSPAVGGRTP